MHGVDKELKLFARASFVSRDAKRQTSPSGALCGLCL
jgi:hypothetical protein